MSVDHLIGENLKTLYKANNVDWKEERREDVVNIELRMPSLEDRPCPLACPRCGFSAIVDFRDQSYDYDGVEFRFKNLRNLRIQGCPIQIEFDEKGGQGADISAALDILDEIPAEDCLINEGNLGIDQDGVVKGTLSNIGRKLAGF